MTENVSEPLLKFEIMQYLAFFSLLSISWRLACFVVDDLAVEDPIIDDLTEL